MSDQDELHGIPEGTKTQVFNLNTFLKENEQACESVASVWEAKASVKTAKTMITRGIKEMTEIFNNLDKEQKSPPLNHMMIRKWRELYLSKKESVNQQLLGLMDYLERYNKSISSMANSINIGDKFAPFEERCMVSTVTDYEAYANNFMIVSSSVMLVKNIPLLSALTVGTVVRLVLQVEAEEESGNL